MKIGVVGKEGRVGIVFLPASSYKIFQRSEYFNTVTLVIF